MPRRKTASANLPQKHKQQLLPIVEHWILKLLVPLKGYQHFLMFRSFSDDDLAEAIGLGCWLDPELSEFDATKILVQLKNFARQSEKNLPTFLPSPLQQNIDKLAALAGLSEVDCKILAFAVMLKNHQLLDCAADTLGKISTSDLLRVLSQLLDVPESDIRSSLSPLGLLSKSGLLALDRSGDFNISGKFELLSYTFADTIYTADAEPVFLLRDVVTPATPPQLQWHDYDHVAELMQILCSYMGKAVIQRRKGINILIYGYPGTGKSQLARVLAADLKRELFEVAFADEEGDSVSGERRLRAYRAAQCFFAHRDALLVFDEAEDVLGGADLFDLGRTQSRKAWINRTLEDNPVPALWLSNDVDTIDPAVIRRFDIVIELPIPSRKHRSRILQKLCGNMLSDTDINVFAQSDALSPAVVENSATIVNSIKSELSVQNLPHVIKLLTNSTLKAQGHKPIAKSTFTALPLMYDPVLVNCDTDPIKLAQGIKNATSARLCLLGKPGTGKTAYVHWVAQELDKPIIIKKASDLLGMYVGQTEQRIAQAFVQAEEEDAVLLIDEVDSVLQDRRTARASWEVTMVNEMLKQMEAFEGIFFASTNLMENLDQAALRRFDLKLRFNYLTPTQSTSLLKRYCAQLELESPGSDALTTVAAMKVLTPGDFMTVSRQHRFSPFPCARALAAALQEECMIKEDQPIAIGFIH